MSAEDVRKLHTEFKVYDECIHDHKSEDEPGVVYIEDVGLTCDDAVVYVVCRECDTTDGETHEHTDEGKWPCRTIEALEKQPEDEPSAKDIAEWLAAIRGECLIAAIHGAGGVPTEATRRVVDWLERLAARSKP